MNTVARSIVLAIRELLLSVVVVVVSVAGLGELGSVIELNLLKPFYLC